MWLKEENGRRRLSVRYERTRRFVVDGKDGSAVRLGSYPSQRRHPSD
jgi:hypothetical protein